MSNRKRNLLICFTIVPFIYCIQLLKHNIFCSSRPFNKAHITLNLVCAGIDFTLKLYEIILSITQLNPAWNFPIGQYFEEFKRSQSCRLLDFSLARTPT